MEYMVRTIKGTGCMSAVNVSDEPIIVSHGTINGMYDKKNPYNPYVFIPVEVKTDDCSKLAVAMFDTGANACFISDNLRRKMNLVPFAEDKVGNANDFVKSGVYRIGLKIDDIKLKNVVTMEFSNSEFLGADIVIGMNVISLGEFCISKDGTFSFEV